MASQVELTPCGAMFDIFKRAAHLSHIELCGLVPVSYTHLTLPTT